MRDDRTPEEEEKLRQAKARADARWREGYITYLATRGHLRAIRKALTEKLTYSEMAAQIGVSEQRVVDLAGLLDGGRSAEESAFEAIVRATIEDTPRQELIAKLAAWEWPEVAYDPYAVPPKDWYRTHRDAVIQGLMTAAEVAEIDHMRSGAPGPYVPAVPPTAEEEEAHLRGRLIEIHAHADARRSALAAVTAGDSVTVAAIRFGLRPGLVAADVRDEVERPGHLDPDPGEIIQTAWLNGSDRRELVEVLCAIEFTDDLYAPGYLEEGMLAGTWRDVVRAHYGRGGVMLSEEEFEEIERRRKPLIPHPDAGKYGTEAPGE